MCPGDLFTRWPVPPGEGLHCSLLMSIYSILDTVHRACGGTCKREGTRELLGEGESSFEFEESHKNLCAQNFKMAATGEETPREPRGD